MNLHAIRAIYTFEMARAGRTLLQSIVSPVLSTSLYFVVFGSAIGSRMAEIDGVSYGAFIVPGLIMLSLLTQSISNASFGIYFPTLHRHDLRGAVGAGLVRRDRHRLCRRGRDQIDHPRPDHPGDGAHCSCRCSIEHPFWMLGFLVLTAVTFSLFGFIIGIWADGFEKLQLVPLLIVTPLTFLGGSFYSIDMLPPVWRTITLFNPVVYLISGFRWSFYGMSDVSVGISLAMTLAVPRRLPDRRLVDLQDRLPAEIRDPLPRARQFETETLFWSCPKGNRRQVMKRMVGVALGLVIAAGAMAQSDVIAQRKDLMKANGAATRLGTQMVRGEAPFDLAKAREIFTGISQRMERFPTLFPENSKTGGDTHAAPRFGRTCRASGPLPQRSSRMRTRQPGRPPTWPPFRRAFRRSAQTATLATRPIASILRERTLPQFCELLSGCEVRPRCCRY